MTTAIWQRVLRTVFRLPLTIVDETFEKGVELVKGPPKPYMAQVDKGVFRGSEPSDARLDELANMGVKTVLDLRWDVDDEGMRVMQRGMRYHNDPGIADGTVPLDKDLDGLLKVLANPANQPVYVHCREGTGRTGILIACYQIRFKGYTADQAIAEAKSFGLNFPWQLAYIKHFAREEAQRKS
jgi:tyrosine-protein phosphatase SIW14